MTPLYGLDKAAQVHHSLTCPVFARFRLILSAKPRFYPGYQHQRPSMLSPAEVAHGPMFIGYLFKCLLQGILMMQGYLYFTRFKKDRTFLKVIVALLMLADTVNIVFNTIYLYSALVIHFGDKDYLARSNWGERSRDVLLRFMLIRSYINP
ncbi:hypothetical protein HGRIS_000691 [Hohenbuehelia grisea]|uniref:Uncharacterized protein n=1 Tax=Hohenbuehelia grisea TaxID=104357 RepID=A0ABR3JSJ8_9AGAR